MAMNLAGVKVAQVRKRYADEHRDGDIKLIKGARAGVKLIGKG